MLLVLAIGFVGGLIAETFLGWGVKIRAWVKEKINN